MSEITVGGSIIFGTYWQSADGAAAKKPIVWRVVETDRYTALVIARHGVLCPGNICSKPDSLRKWLNRDFLCDAFSDIERIAIRPSTCPLHEKIFIPPDCENAVCRGGECTVIRPAMRVSMNYLRHM